MLPGFDSLALRVAIGSVMVEIALPGWRWEIEFMADGALEIERFQSVASAQVSPGPAHDPSARTTARRHRRCSARRSAAGPQGIWTFWGWSGEHAIAPV